MSTAITPEEIRLDDITHSTPAGSCRSLKMLRLDTLHPVISGNKLFKLRLNLEAARWQNCDTILTFGGAYSNHLIATAEAARAGGFGAIGIVRGEDPGRNPAPTLAACRNAGMALHFVSRAEYAEGARGSTCRDLTNTRNSRIFVVPEGGANEWGRQGAADIALFMPENTTHICLPVGTGTTMTGLLKSAGHCTITGFPALNDLALAARIFGETNPPARHRLVYDYTFGGFARTTPALLSFMKKFFADTTIPTDIVYTGKMMFGMEEMLRHGTFEPGARIVCIHTGGLQGNPAGLFD